MDRDQVRARTSGDSANATFWRNQLQNALPVPQLPGCRPSTPALSAKQAVIEQALPAVLAQRLQAAALQSGNSAFDWMLAGWALLLARLGGQADVVVGVPAPAGAVLPLFVQVDGTTRVLDLVRCTAESVEKAEAFRDALAEDAAAAVHWMFSADTALVPVPDLDFHLQVSTEASPFARLHYREALCEPASAERLLGQFVTVLDAMLADPAQVAARVALMTAAERHQLLVGFNDTAAEVPRDLLMHQPFEARAAAQPDAPALFAGDRMLSYGELNARANRLAHRLIALGVRPNDRVAICVERSIEMVVGLLGVLKAGGAYVPLDPDYPADRLAYMVADCAPVALLTQAARQAGLPKVDIPVIALDGDAALAEQAATNPDAGALGLDAGHTAYVIYTSGSTGRPKGASVFHRGLVNLLHWYSNDYGVTAQDRALIVSSFSFDLTQKNLFVCLFAGGQLHLAGQQFDPAAIVKTVSQHAITTLNLTPSAFYALVDAHQPASFASLRRVFLGGEPISVPRLAALGASYPLLDIVNSYGPTECTDVCAAYTLPRDGATYADQTPPIGRPICNTQLYVLDAHLQPVPIGVTGEIYIGGAGVGGGYLHRPDMTAERFIPDHLAAGAAPGALLYKTGDQGRWRTDGLLDYLGRNDFQVKIRGFRIELGEIESRLVACAGVREAIVIARDDVPGEKRLVAYLMPAEGATLDTNALRAELVASLADYMVPSAFVVLPAFPLTPSGKVDRKALPAPERKRPDLAVPYQSPVGDFEAAACAAFAEVLEIDRAGREDNFFDLGGSSLQAVRVLTMLATRTGQTLSAPTIFAHATPPPWRAPLRARVRTQRSRCPGATRRSVPAS